MSVPDLRVDAARAALLIVDVQDRLAAAMSAASLERVERNIGILCEAARRYEIPVVVSQQYPRGLGETREPIRKALEPLGTRVHWFDKLEFSAARAEPFGPLSDRIARSQWIVTGMECHVCVYQTVRDLCGRGAVVHVPGDAVISRHDDNWRVGIDLMKRAGAIVTSTEVIVFDLLGRAGSDDFKALSRLVR
jgi:nicotinamidase-related amidase